MFLDIETNGLDPDTIWVAVTMQDNVVQEHYDRESLAKALEGDFPVVGHNLIGFDIPVLEKPWAISVDKRRVQDTLVMSRLANPQREGGHRLVVWGGKGDHDDWSCLSRDMVDYCVQDVRVTAKAYNKLKLELRKFSQQSIDLEHETQWIVQKQIRNGWLLDMRHAMDLLATLKERKLVVEEEVHKVFKPKWVDVKQVVPKTKKDGSLSKVGLTDDEYQRVLDTGDRSPFMRKMLKPFNLGSRQQIGEYLKDFGWKPCKLTPTGQPIVDEAVLSTVKDIPQAALIAEYLMLQKRVAQVQSWVDEANPDTDRVHGYVNTNGAVTGRMTHSKPNLAQVPASYSPYGKECRQCWIARDGYKLVGFDASGLELRMLAHYMDDKEYTNEVINGDIHTANQHLAGLESRDQAKTFIYALLYGAGDEKLGSVASAGRAAGKTLRERFMSNLTAYADLKDRVSREAVCGWISGLDGRKLYIRSEHAALNTLLQSAGAIVMKKALCLLQEYAILWNLDYYFVGNIHDEVQAEVRADHADKYGRLAVSCLEAAGIELGLNCKLTGEYKVGTSWAETH
jgi:DNA polymerase I-like protein with 3'-5' exonuclease and polymerase domains